MLIRLLRLLILPVFLVLRLIAPIWIITSLECISSALRKILVCVRMLLTLMRLNIGVKVTAIYAVLLASVKLSSLPFVIYLGDLWKMFRFGTGSY